MIEHIEPKATADGVAVYCAHDKIVDTDSLVGNPRNPNKHPKEQITALAKIIKCQGWRHPIVVSNRSGFVVKGHGRLLAAKEIGAKQVPVDFQDYESEASEYADLMADNKIQEFSELDMKMSADILQDIKDSGDIELEMSAFTEEALNELAESIKNYGVFQPIIVKKSIKGYDLIAGERRLRASKLAGMETIPAIVKEFSDEEMREISLLENIQRENLTAIELAWAYKGIIDT